MYIKKTKIMKFKYYLAFLLLSLCSIAVHAYDFEVDGIYYNVLDLTKRTVEVTPRIQQASANLAYSLHKTLFWC